MYVLDYLIYHLRPYGIIGHAQPLPDRLTISDMQARFDKSDQDKVDYAATESNSAVTKIDTKD